MVVSIVASEQRVRVHQEKGPASAGKSLTAML
jgi:hypothetical protein